MFIPICIKFNKLVSTMLIPIFQAANTYQEHISIHSPIVGFKKEHIFTEKINP